MKLYTKTGDQGETSIIGGRVSKDDHRVEAYGTIDEANSMLGCLISLLPQDEIRLRTELTQIQHELFDCGSDLSRKVKKDEEPSKWKITQEQVASLEQKIDEYTGQAPSLERFILPGGSVLAATTHLLRTIVRRAERRVVSLARLEIINPFVLHYLNRLSDYFFSLARYCNQKEGIQDIEYVRSAKVFKIDP